MRSKLLYNPRLLCERLAEISLQRRRQRRLRGTLAEKLKPGHIDSLELLELLKSKRPRIIYDIGAYIGTWTVLAKAIFPDSEVHAFEPLDQIRDDFFRTTQGLSNIHYHQIGIGAATGEMTMKVASFLDSSSFLAMTQAQIREFKVHPAGTTTVRVERLDEYVTKKSLPQPDLLKLDVQGYELETLRGAEESLASASAVISEVSFIELYKGQCLFGDLVAFLASRGFHVRALGAKSRLGVRLVQTDVLFEKSMRSFTTTRENCE